MTEQEAIKDLREEIEKCYEQCEGACSTVKNDKCCCRDGIIFSFLEKVKLLLEKSAEEIENLYGRETDLTIEIRDFLNS